MVTTAAQAAMTAMVVVAMVTVEVATGRGDTGKDSSVSLAIYTGVCCRWVYEHRRLDNVRGI